MRFLFEFEGWVPRSLHDYGVKFEIEAENFEGAKLVARERSRTEVGDLNFVAWDLVKMTQIVVSGEKMVRLPEMATEWALVSDVRSYRAGLLAGVAKGLQAIKDSLDCSDWERAQKEIDELVVEMGVAPWGLRPDKTAIDGSVL